MTRLSEKAMLARLNICQWTARKYDKKVSAEVAANHGTTTDAGRYNKVLVAKSALAEIVTAANAARSFHDENTLPWHSNGARILPSGNYLAYTERMRQLRSAFESKVAAFVDNYAAYVDDARARLNGLFDDADYPTVKEIKRRFGFAVDVDPLPDKEDFRVTLADGEIARIQAEIEERTNAAIAGAVKDLWERVHETVSHMAERLHAYSVDAETEKVSNPFRDTLVSNLRDLVDLLPRLNVTADKSLEDMRQRLAERLLVRNGADVTADQLRKDGALRESVAQECDSIMRDMAGYFGG